MQQFVKKPSLLRAHFAKDTYGLCNRAVFLAIFRVILLPLIDILGEVNMRCNMLVAASNLVCCRTPKHQFRIGNRGLIGR